MNKEPKKRISISVPLDMLEKIERVNQDVYHGHMKVLNVMLCLVDIGMLAVDYWGTCRRATIALEQYAEQREKELDREQEPAEYKKRALSKILRIIANPKENERPLADRAEGG